MHELKSRLLTTDEVCEMLRLNRRQLENMRYNGTGPKYLKLPTGWIRYQLSDVEDWVFARSTTDNESTIDSEVA